MTHLPLPPPSPRPAPAATARAHGRPATPHARDDTVRQSFEQHLRRAARAAGEGDDAAADEAPAPSAWPAVRTPDEASGPAGRSDAADDVAAAGAPIASAPVEPSGQAQPGAASASTSVMAGGAPASPLFEHLARPLSADAGAARFDVLNGAGVTGVAVAPLPQGGTAVTVVASAAQAAVLEHHLPQLQRRLADRVQLRVRASGPHDDAAER